VRKVTSLRWVAYAAAVAAAFPCRVAVLAVMSSWVPAFRIPASVAAVRALLFGLFGSHASTTRSLLCREPLPRWTAAGVCAAGRGGRRLRRIGDADTAAPWGAVRLLAPDRSMCDHRSCQERVRPAQTRSFLSWPTIIMRRGRRAAARTRPPHQTHATGPRVKVPG